MAVARVQAQEDIAEGRVRHERSLSDLSAMKQQLASGTERCAAYEAELAETRQRTAKLARRYEANHSVRFFGGLTRIATVPSM